MAAPGQVRHLVVHQEGEAVPAVPVALREVAVQQDRDLKVVRVLLIHLHKQLRAEAGVVREASVKQLLVPQAVMAEVDILGL